MVASTILRAGHLAVAGVKVTAVAEREAVGRVGAEKVGRRRLHQRDVHVVRRVDQLAVDRL